MQDQLQQDGDARAEGFVKVDFSDRARKHARSGILRCAVFLKPQSFSAAIEIVIDTPWPMR